MKSLFQIIKENISNFYLIIRLSLFEVKSANSSHYLGLLWEILNPLILIGIYWFVFGYGIRGGKPVDGIDYLPWMLSGISVWFFISQVIILGSKSIYTRMNIISKMNFPISAIPTFVIASKYYSHVVLVGIVMVIIGIYGYKPGVHFLQLPYYMFANLILLISISLITSTLSTIIRDVQMFIQAIVRVLMYVTPILWSTEKLPSSIVTLMKLNPIYYIVEGYRASLLGSSWYFIAHARYTIYFWCLVIVLLFLGSIIHVRFRKHFVDYL
jgi:teichoic acid transport system permease protein